MRCLDSGQGSSSSKEALSWVLLKLLIMRLLRSPPAKGCKAGCDGLVSCALSYT